MKIEEAFGKVLSKHRRLANFTQEKLSFDAGLDRSFISLIEAGRKSPTISTIFKICFALRIKPSDLIRDVEELINSTDEES